MEDYMALNSVNLTFLPIDRGKILCPYCSQAAKMKFYSTITRSSGNVFISLKCEACDRIVRVSFWQEEEGVHVEAITD